MKRSEVKRVISQYLMVDRFYFEKAEEDAEELLTLLEKMGLRPTEAESFGSHYTVYNVTKWEPEDG